jgi:P-type Cu+ transporter
VTASVGERPSPAGPRAVEPSAATPYWAETLADGRARFRAKIGGLHCSLCTGTIEKALGRLPGVDSVAVSLTHEQTLVEYDPALVQPAALLGTLRDIGYTVWDPRKTRAYELEEADLVREARRLFAAIGFSLATLALILRFEGIWTLLVPATTAVTLLAVAFLILRGQSLWTAVAGTAALVAVTGALVASNLLELGRPAVPWIVGAFAFLVIFAVAGHILSMAFQSLRRGILNQHVLLEVGAFAGIAGGLIGLIARPAGYPTAAFFGVTVVVANYHIFSEWLSLLVKTRSSQAVKRLLDLQPDTARVVRTTAAGQQEVEVGIGEVLVGDLVRVRPGERIPVDGEVVGGRSAVDQALVTGEPVPVERAEGDGVIGGSINGTGTLLVRATAVGEQSFLQQVVRSVEDARALKPGILHLVDRILTVYAPTVLILAAVALVGWLVGPWLLTGQPDLERAVFAGLSVLVMGYPCAVGIAAPLSIVRGAGEAADQGILMRTGEAFQAFRSVRTVVLDKTGTLTAGRPTVYEIVPAPDISPGISGRVDGGSPDRAADELLAVAAAAETGSEHPLGQAVLDAALDRGLDVPAVEDFESVTGLGVTARLDGQQVLVGRAAFLQEHGIDTTPLAERIAALEESGRTVIAVGREGRLRGIIALGDELRDDAVTALAALRRARLVPVLLTGDNRRAAERVAQQVGIDPEHVHAGVLPGEKAEIIRELQRRGNGRVAMVGDGINDAPALMQADIGIAMGAGTDIALESADVIIIGNRLESILAAREISTRSYRKTQQNVVLAFLFNGIGIPVAATGLIYPVWAMVAMALSVTTIFLNSLWGRPRLFVDAVLSVGRGVPSEAVDSAARPVREAAAA